MVLNSLISASLLALVVGARQVHIIELTKEIKTSEHSGISISPNIYRLEQSIRDDSRVLVNTVEVKDTRRVTSALLPRGFIETLGGVDPLQGRRAHAFVAPTVAGSADSQRKRHQWTHEDFQHVTPHSVIILIDSSSDDDVDHEHDLLTPEATDCLIYDKQISVLITNHRYIDGKRESPASRQPVNANVTSSANFASLELAFLNNGVVLIVSAAVLSPDDAQKMGATTAMPKNGASASFEMVRQKSLVHQKKRHNRRHLLTRKTRQDVDNGNIDFANFFYAYFMIFQPDRTVPVGLAAVTLLNYTTKRPVSLSHDWFPKDAASTPLPLWPGTPKTIVRVSMAAKTGRAMLFSEQHSADVGEQHPAFFSAPLATVAPQFQQQRPPRPHVRIKFAEHFGTHVDAPFHMLPNGSTVASKQFRKKLFSNCCYKVDLSRKILPGRRSWATDRGIGVSDFEEQVGDNVGAGCLPLFHTGVSKYWRNNTLYVNQMVFPGLSQELAAKLLQKSSPVAGVGIDTLSIDPGSSEDLATHVIAAANGAFVLENLNNIQQLPDGGKPVPCLVIPLKIEHGSGSPAKIIAFLGGNDADYDYNSEYDSSYPFIARQTSSSTSRFLSTTTMISHYYCLIALALTIVQLHV